MKTRSTSRENRRQKRKRDRSSTPVKYVSSSDERASPQKFRRRRSSSPSSRHGHEGYHSPESDRDRYVQYKGLMVSSLHSKASDELIKDALYSEFKKYGDVTIRVIHESDERVAYVYFKNPSDARDAKNSKPRVIIYDKVALVEPIYETRQSPDRYRGHSRARSRSLSPAYDRYRKASPPPMSDIYSRAGLYDRIPYPPFPLPPRDLPLHPDFMPRPPLPVLPPPHLLPPHLYGLPPRPFFPFKPYAPFMDRFDKRDRFPNYLHHIPPEDDPLATRTLFVGNLELSVTDEDLKRIFSRHGVVEDVDIKRPALGTGNAYAFVRFKNLDMAHKAKVEVSGQFIGKYQCKIGYGKATPTTRIWVGGLGPWTSIVQLEREFDRFGPIRKIDHDKADNCAYILYDTIEAASAAVKEMRGYPLGGSDHKIRVDYAEISSKVFRNDDSSKGNREKSRKGSYYDSYEPWNRDDYGYSRRSRSYERDRGRSLSSSPGKRRLSTSPVKRSRRSVSAGSEHFVDSSSVKIESARSFSEIARKAELAWKGGLMLKNSVFCADFFTISGDKNIIDDMTFHDANNIHLLRITQRLRLDQSKLDDVTQRLSLSSHGVFIGLPSPSMKLEDDSLQSRPLKNLTSYLKQKEAAGVISVNFKSDDMTASLYAFPPGDYVSKLVRKTARCLTEDNFKEEYVVVIVIKGESALNP